MRGRKNPSIRYLSRSMVLHKALVVIFLATELTDTTTESTAAYRTATFDIVKGRLDEVYHALIARLDAPSSSPDASPALEPAASAPHANINLR